MLLSGLFFSSFLFGNTPESKRTTLLKVAKGSVQDEDDYQITAEGAWCWFADPRALHHENKESKINKTYVGYIDIHGNIKAMQYDFNKQTQTEILIRSCFQPDDHNNPTFLVLPDQRVMIFYSRHTDEPCIYYRISRSPGDITTLGEEKRIETKHNTTYPSPFILSDDPDHIYLCWRGINWHPTLSRLSMPDENDNVAIEKGPFQIVQSTGSRPYAKYTSNGKDKILLTYTTGHPDNESPNFLYYNAIDVQTLHLEDIEGNRLANIEDGPFQINKTDEFVTKYANMVVDHPVERDWVWQINTDRQGFPVIAMVRISTDKTSHDYYRARWTGKEWKKTFLTNGGGHFHQSPTIELCYSGGMAIDPDNTNIIYCSQPVEGIHGLKYELVKYTLDGSDRIVSTVAITTNSSFNNVRPYIIPGSDHSSLRLTWMKGNYYDWIVSSQRPQGYCTGIYSDFKGYVPTPPTPLKETEKGKNNAKFNRNKDFTIALDISLDTLHYEGCLWRSGELSYWLNGETMKPEIRYKDKKYKSTNVLGTSDTWKNFARGTNGIYYAPQKYTRIKLQLEYEKGTLRTYINGLLDQHIELEK